MTIDQVTDESAEAMNEFDALLGTSGVEARLALGKDLGPVVRPRWLLRLDLMTEDHS